MPGIYSRILPEIASEIFDGNSLGKFATNFSHASLTKKILARTQATHGANHACYITRDNCVSSNSKRAMPVCAGLSASVSSAGQQFSCLAAFSHLLRSGVGVLIFDKLPLMHLQNAAFTCKSFHDLVKKDPSLVWRFHFREALRVEELLKLEGSTPRAQKLTTFLFRIRGGLFTTFRKILFDWLVDVQGYCRLSTKTLHMTFNLIDRYFEKRYNIQKDKIQLICAACFWVCARMIETSFPSIDKIVFLTNDTFTRDQVVNKEFEVLSLEKGLVRSVTPFEFVDALCSTLDLPPEIKSCASYLVDLFMVESVSIGVLPSAIAGAGVMFSFDCTGMTETVGVKHIPYLTQTPKVYIRRIICKMLWFYCVDYHANTKLGQADGTLTGQHGAVNRLYSNFWGSEESDSDSCSMSVAQKAPPRTQLMPGECCPWCGEMACGMELLTVFPSHVARCRK